METAGRLGGVGQAAGGPIAPAYQAGAAIAQGQRAVRGPEDRDIWGNGVGGVRSEHCKKNARSPHEFGGRGMRARPNNRPDSEEAETCAGPSADRHRRIFTNFRTVRLARVTPSRRTSAPDSEA